MDREASGAVSAAVVLDALSGDAGRALCAAAAAVARLDDRVAAAPEAVRRGWLNHTLLEEAAASARLDGIVVDAGELRLHAIGALAADAERTGGGADRVELAAGTLRVLRAVTARHPRQLFTANRLAAAARLRLRGRPRDVRSDPRIPDWLVAVPDPAAARAALSRALSADAMAVWRRMPPPLAAADLLGRWSATGCTAAIGGAVGRALVPMLMTRLGATGGPVLFPAIGYLGHAWEYRPDRLGPDPARDGGSMGAGVAGWLDACRRAAERGLALLARVAEAHARLHAALKPARSSGRGALVADLLTVTPALTGAMLARRSGLSDVAVRALLHRAVQAGALHELTGRAAFRVYGPLR